MRSMNTPYFAGFASLLGLLVLCPQPARADPVSISYTVHQVSGSTWEYQYSVSGGFSQGDDLAISFPVGTSLALVDTSFTDADVSTYVLQPDPSLPASGEFDLLANANDPNLLRIFSASFVYTGQDTPGSQTFSLYDSSFNLRSSGTTTAAMSAAETPEPGSVLLAATGALAALGMLRRRVL